MSLDLSLIISLDMENIFKKATIEDPNGVSEESLDIEYLSASRIKQLSESAFHYKRRYIDNVKPEDTPSKKIGRIVHSALLQPEDFKSRFHILPEFKGTGSRKAKADHIESLPSETIIITEDESERILNMINNIQTHKRANHLLQNSIAEQKIYAYDKEFDITWHGILDIYRKGNVIVEVKSTQNSKLDPFRKDYAKFKYHIQAWIYRRIVEILIGEKPKSFTIAIESKEPHCVSVFNHPASLFEQAEFEIRQAIDLYKKCKASGQWDYYYSDKIIPLDLPSYYVYNTNEEIELND